MILIPNRKYIVKPLIIIVYLFLEVFELVVELIDYLFPKDDRTVVFGSNGGEYCTGSSKALYEYMKSINCKHKLFYYRPFRRDLGLIAKVKYILNFVPTFFKAKVLVSTHPPSDFLPFTYWSSKKIFINLWHGTPMKKIFFMDPFENSITLRRIIKLNKRTSAFIVSSKLEALLIMKTFQIEPEKLFFTGHPRNDILLKKSKICKLPFLEKNVPNYEKVFLYCPTYRRNDTAEFFPFSDFDLKHFEEFLERNEIIILVRSHPYDKKPNIPLSKRILNFNFDVFENINEILPNIDVLITDYSSIYIDFLLQDKPCIFIPYDIEEYTKKRGFLLNYEFLAAGDKVFTYKEFIDAINKILSGKDPYRVRRQTLRRIFHYYQTENSCERVFQLMKFLLVGNRG